MVHELLFLAVQRVAVAFFGSLKTFVPGFTASFTNEDLHLALICICHAVWINSIKNLKAVQTASE